MEICQNQNELKLSRTVLLHKNLIALEII